MGNLIIILLLAWVILSILGFVVKGLLWLAAVGIALFLATLLWGWIKSKAKKQ